MKTFAYQLKQKRKKANMTQAELAKRLGVSWITVWRWENARTKPPAFSIKGILDSI